MQTTFFAEIFGSIERRLESNPGPSEKMRVKFVVDLQKITCRIACVNSVNQPMAQQSTSFKAQPRTKAEPIQEQTVISSNLLNFLQQNIWDFSETRCQIKIVGANCKIWVIHKNYTSTAIEQQVFYGLCDPRCWNALPPSMNDDSKIPVAIASICAEISVEGWDLLCVCSVER